MQTIGLLGGMSWESSALYYQVINETVRERLGGYHSARLVLFSVDFAEIEEMQAAGDWDGALEILGAAAQALERAGADVLVLCTNTMHKLADDIANRITIPFLHIAKATADAVLARGLQTVGLLGTRYTMEQPFYREKLEEYGLKVLIPDKSDRDTVHNVIYDELVKGVIREESRTAYQNIIRSLTRTGAQAVILGCTEIGLLVKQEDSHVPLFDTAYLHAVHAVNFALG